METLLQKKGFIRDMDGVIYHGNRLLPGVPEISLPAEDDPERRRGYTGSMRIVHA